ncbi:MAG: CBS domain-containing protein [Nitrososphaerales archaeon]
MPRVKEVMSKSVVTIDVSNSAYDVVREMMNRDIGSVIVTRKGKVAGVVTKGDILRETIMKKADPQKMKAEEIMSQPVMSVDPETTLEEASQLMAKSNVSKLPVIKDGKLFGIVTSTDLIRKSGRKKIADDLV